MLSYKIFSKSFWHCLTIGVMLVVSSCANDGYDQFLDSSQGQSGLPNSNQNFFNQQPSYGHSAPPSYGQRQAPYQQPSPYQQAPNPYYYQQPQPSYYQQQAPSYQPYGGSRYYSNPYAIPPSSRYPNYDADQYYVPPSYYNNVEPVQPNGLTGGGAFKP